MTIFKENPAGKDGPRFRVLIADDVKETRRSARLMMTLLPFVEVVAVAENGAEAVELAQQHRPDIVVMDINMPEMDGLTAVKTMLKHRPETACIIMSAQRDSTTLHEAISAGARGYLVKPFTTDQLVDTMTRVAGGLNHKGLDSAEADRLRQQRDVYLKELATEYIKTRRTDEKAVEVFETLTRDPECEPKWLMALAMIYMARRQWGDLKLVAERLERLA